MVERPYLVRWFSVVTGFAFALAGGPFAYAQPTAVGSSTTAAVGTSTSSWMTLAPGVEYTAVQVVSAPKAGDGRLHMVRVDSTKARLMVEMASNLDGKNRTAREWAERGRRVAVINAGMYETDHSTHTGYLRAGHHENSRRWIGDYKSALMIDRRGQGRIVDVLKRPGDLRHHPSTIVQNLRLIAGPGRNAWSENNRRWSEAAIAMDDTGRILFLFCRTPFSMRRFNFILLGLGLGITHAHHVEGGPEASLSIRSPSLQLDLAGSYETGFVEGDGNVEQWPLPNVISVIRAP